jgi:hypothetical protein
VAMASKALSSCAHAALLVEEDTAATTSSSWSALRSERRW